MRDWVLWQIQMFQLSICVQMLNGLDTIPSKIQVLQQHQILQPLNGQNTIMREIQRVQVVQPANTVHTQQLIAHGGQLKNKMAQKQMQTVWG